MLTGNELEARFYWLSIEAVDDDVVLERKVGIPPACGRYHRPNAMDGLRSDFS